MAGNGVAIMDQRQFELANRLFFRLYQASNLLHKTGTRSLNDVGATTQQWAVLGALARPGVVEAGLNVKALIEFLLLSRQNLTAVIDRLEERGWVERAKDAGDGRSRRIRLTTEGRKVWAEMHDRIDAFYSAALLDFSNAERSEFHRLLDKLKISFSAMTFED
jgi:DNA-binding MarR family transcriptional regulator